MREEFKKILAKHGIYEEPEDVLNAVSDMLDYAADEMKARESYAVNSIKRLRNAAYEVFSLVNEI